MSKTYLRLCCGPCGTASTAKLRRDGHQVIGFFSNSNIDTREEFDRRLAETKKLGIEIIVDDYDHNDWLEYINNHFRNSKSETQNSPEGGERCRHCMYYRLERLCKYLQDGTGGVTSPLQVTTSLFISPYKNYHLIASIAKDLEKSYNIRYLDYDFSGQYQKSIQISKDLNMYRQKYCGCEFSRNK